MKRLYFLCMCLLLIGTVNPAIANLTGIQIISQQYHVYGYYSGFGDGDVLQSDEYNLYSTDGSSISGRIENGELGAFAASSAGQISDGHFSVEAYAYAFIWSDGWADASISLLFQPEESGWLHAGLYPDDPRGRLANVNLSDSTAGVQLFDAWFILDGGSYDFWVYDTHVYSLNLFAGSSQADGTRADANLSFTPIPAPSAILLGSIGLGFVSWLRRRKQI